MTHIDPTTKTLNFSLVFDPDDNKYDFQITTPPTVTYTFDTSQGTLQAGGPDAVRTLLFGGSADGSDDIVFFGANAIADPDNVQGLVEQNLSESDIESQLASYSDIINSSTKMNVSTAGIGINNNNLNGADQGLGTGDYAGTTITSGDESFVVNPEALVDSLRVYISSTVQGYTPSTEDLYYRVYYSDGTYSSIIDVTTVTAIGANDASFPKVVRGGSYFDIDAGDKQIDAVQLIMGKGEIKIPIIGFSVEQPFEPQDLMMNFTASLTDGDSDVATDAFAINVGIDPTLTSHDFLLGM